MGVAATLPELIEWTLKGVLTSRKSGCRPSSFLDIDGPVLGLFWTQQAEMNEV